MSLTKAMKAAKYAAAEEERKFLAEEASGEGEKSDEGASAENLESNLDAEAFEATEGGSL